MEDPMKKFLVAVLLLAVAASTGCFVEVDDGLPRHRHCFGCGHVYIKGHWR